MTPESIEQIKQALTIIKGNAQLVKETSTEGLSIHSGSIINAQVDRIVKLLEEK